MPMNPAIVSLPYVMNDGVSAEIAVVGNEGLKGVTEAAGNLQKAGLIKYNRGHITVLDRAGLEARVCLRMLRRGQEGVRTPATGSTRSVDPNPSSALALDFV